jgi:hypothetical protein
MGWRDDPLTQPAPVSRPAPVTRPGSAQKRPAWADDPVVSPTLAATAPQASAPAPKAEEPLSWADVPGKAIQNAPASALEFGKAIVQPILHPIDTGKAIFDVGYGLASKLHGAIGGTQDPERKTKDEAAANAVGEHFKSRYGSMDGLKKALAEDPVGVLADVSVVLTGGGAALSRGPGVVAKVGEVASKTGNAIDPLVNAGRAVSATGTAAANVLGVTTGAGTRPFQEAYAAGRAGNRSFPDNMRDRVPQSDVLELADSAVGQMGKARSEAYTAGMAQANASQQPLSLRPAIHAIEDARDMAYFRGVPKSEAAAKVIDAIEAKVAEFTNIRGLGQRFQTAESLDALKQSIGEIRQTTQQGTLERKIADRVYNKIKDQIVQEVPKYADTMKDYQSASDLINEARRTLSINDLATADTTMRKLQSTMRDGVSTNYGQRGRVLDELAQYEPSLPAALAGQSLNAWAPRGLARLSSPTAVATLGSQMNPLSIPLAAMSSPRLMGEMTYAAGRGAGMVEQAANALGLTPQMLLNMARAGYVSNALSPRDPAQN